jgi:hypothetical protein
MTIQEIINISEIYIIIIILLILLHSIKIFIPIYLQYVLFLLFFTCLVLIWIDILI